MYAFEDEMDALRWAETNAVDVAFLDIELHSMNGLEVAEELLRIHPQIAIVFCTSYEQYAVKAIKMHIDAGYLIKPLRKSQIHEEIDHIAEKRMQRQRLKVKCFGEFEALVDNRPLETKRKKTKELLAYLIDRRGAAVTTAQICVVLWEEEIIDNKKRDMFYHLVADLKGSLDAVGLNDVFLSGSSGYSINTGAVDCDYYRMLEGDEKAARQYIGEYMNQYSWAETTNSWLAREVRKW